MTNPGGWFILAETNGFISSDARENDLVIHTAQPTQSILFNVGRDTPSVMMINSNMVNINANMSFAGGLTSTRDYLNIMNSTFLQDGSIICSNLSSTNVNTENHHASNLNAINLYSCNVILENTQCTNINIHTANVSNVFSDNTYSSNTFCKELVASNALVEKAHIISIRADDAFTHNHAILNLTTSNIHTQYLSSSESHMQDVYVSNLLASDLVSSNAQVHNLTLSSGSVSNLQVETLHCSSATLERSFSFHSWLDQVAVSNAVVSTLSVLTQFADQLTASNGFFQSAHVDNLTACNVTFGDIDSLANINFEYGNGLNLNINHMHMSNAKCQLQETSNAFIQHLGASNADCVQLHAYDAHLDSLHNNLLQSSNLYSHDLAASNVYGQTITTPMALIEHATVHDLVNTNAYIDVSSNHTIHASNIIGNELVVFLSHTYSASVSNLNAQEAFLSNVGIDTLAACNVSIRSLACEEAFVHHVYASNMQAGDVCLSNTLLLDAKIVEAHVQHSITSNAQALFLEADQTALSNAFINNAFILDTYCSNIYVHSFQASNATIMFEHADVLSANTAHVNQSYTSNAHVYDLFCSNAYISDAHVYNLAASNVAIQNLKSSNIVALHLAASNTHLSNATIDNLDVHNALFHNMHNATDSIIINSNLYSAIATFDQSYHQHEHVNNLHGSNVHVSQHLQVNTINVPNAHVDIAGDMIVYPSNQQHPTKHMWFQHLDQSAAIKINGIEDTFAIQVGASNLLQPFTNQKYATKMFFDTKGHIGINCNMPTETLAVFGTAQISGTVGCQKPSHPFSFGLVAHYIFDDLELDSGTESEYMFGDTTFDHSPYGRRAFFTGLMSRIGSLDGFPSYGKKLIINSDDGCLTLAHPTPHASTITVCLWFKYSTSNTNDTQSFSSLIASELMGWLLIDKATNALGFGSFSSTTGFLQGFNPLNYSITPNKWYHITLVVEAYSVIKLYVNGVCMSAINHGMDSFTVKYIGNDAWYQRSAKGLYADVRIYNRSLLENEICQIVNLMNTSVVLPSIEQHRKVVLYDQQPDDNNMYCGFGIVNKALTYQTASNQQHRFMVGSNELMMLSNDKTIVIPVQNRIVFGSNDLGISMDTTRAAITFATSESNLASISRNGVTVGATNQLVFDSNANLNLEVLPMFAGHAKILSQTVTSPLLQSNLLLQGETVFSSNVLPVSTDQLDIGSASSNWRSVYLQNMVMSNQVLSATSSNRMMTHGMMLNVLHVGSNNVYDHSSNNISLIGPISLVNQMGCNGVPAYLYANDKGYFGINIDDPKFNVDVHGDINMTGILYQNGTIWKSSYWEIDSNEAVPSKMWFLRDIGIGTSNIDADAMLHVAGDALFNSNVSVHKQLRFKKDQLNTSIQVQSPSVTSGADTNMVLVINSSNDTDAFKFVALNTEVARITGAGNVGIGVVNPQYQLHVAKDAYIAQNLAIGSSLSTSHIQTNTLTTALQAYFNSQVFLKDNFLVSFENRVGLDVLFPDYKFHVNGSVGITSGGFFVNNVALIKPSGEFEDQVIRSANIATHGITNTNLGNQIVDTRTIANNSVVTDHIVDESITTSKYGIHSIINEKLATESVNERAIADYAVTTNKFANFSVTMLKLGYQSVGRYQLSNASIYSPHLTNDCITTDSIANSAVTTDKIALDAVKSFNIADDAITTHKIQDSSVTASKIADYNITSTQIQPLSLTTDTLSNEAVTYSKLAPNSIYQYHITNDAISTSHVTDQAITVSKLANAAVDTLALSNQSITPDKLVPTFFSTQLLPSEYITEREIASNAILPQHIASNTILSYHLSNEAVTSEKIAAQAVLASHIANASITNIKLAPNAVDSNVIAPGSITTFELSNACITTSKLANGTITGDKIAGYTITAINIQDNTITTSKLADGMVTTDKIANYAVRDDKIAIGGISSPLMFAAGVVNDNALSIACIDNSKLQPDCIKAINFETGCVTANAIQNYAVNNYHLQNASITTEKLSPDISFNKLFVYPRAGGQEVALGWSNFMDHQYAVSQSMTFETAINSGINKSLHFRIGGQDSITISPLHNVGIGTQQPLSKLHVKGDAMLDSINNTTLSVVAGPNMNANVSLWNNTDPAWTITNQGSSNNTLQYMNGQNCNVLSLSQQGNLSVFGSVVQSSDRSLKTEITEIAEALDKINQLNGYTFRKHGDSRRSVGLIAQEVHNVLPEATRVVNDYMSLDYSGLMGLVVGAIKELTHRVTQIETRMNSL